MRRKYLLWEERRLPCFVAEVTSATTKENDARDGRKWKLYESLGIDEYFLFDPEGDYLDPRLQGYYLAGGRYRPIASHSDGSLLSTTTGILFRADGIRLCLTHAATGAAYLRREEKTLRLRALEQELARLRGR